MEKFIQVGKPVTGKQLIGREKEIEEIIRLLNQGQSIVLIAPRRFGKTSLLLEILIRMKKSGSYTSYVDVFSTPSHNILAEQITESVLANKKLGKIFRKLKNNVVEMFKNLQLRQEIEGFEFLLGFAQKNVDPWKILSESIDFVDQFSLKNNKIIIFGFDEFGDIKKLNGSKIIKLFRSKIQFQKNSIYIFSGSYESVMNSLFVSEKAPFYRMTRIINLSYINKKSFFTYLKNRLEESGINFSDDFIHSILTFTKGHPYYTQLILQHIIISSSLNRLKVPPDLRLIQDELLIIEKNFLEKSWDELSYSSELRQLLLVLARGKETLYTTLDPRKINISRTLINLKGKGVIYKEKNKYYFTDPLLEYWIKRKILRLNS